MVLSSSSSGFCFNSTGDVGLHMAIIRSIFAAILGYVVFAASAVLLFQVTGHRPHTAAPLPFMAGTVAYGMLFAALGGWVAAWIAARRPVAHGVALTALIATGAVVSLVFSSAAATWSQWSALFLMAPVAIAGSYWRSRRIRV
jgi:multisubunit Na+/H+ antiporter MnhC subunit